MAGSLATTTPLYRGWGARDEFQRAFHWTFGRLYKVALNGGRLGFPRKPLSLLMLEWSDPPYFDPGFPCTLSHFDYCCYFQDIQFVSSEDILHFASRVSDQVSCSGPHEGSARSYCSSRLNRWINKINKCQTSMRGAIEYWGDNHGTRVSATLWEKYQPVLKKIYLPAYTQGNLPSRIMTPRQKKKTQKENYPHRTSTP